MRVISGKFKGKRLFSPAHDGVRPTSDKVKESVFNILASKQRLENSRVLDLFCGSGALGIEAMSRGAAQAVFVDLDPQSIKLAKQNLAHVKADSFEIYPADYRLALKRLENAGFDIIFLDPPYAANLLENALGLILRHNVLVQGGVIVCEHSHETDFTKIMNGYIIDTRRFGRTFITLLQKE